MLHLIRKNRSCKVKLALVLIWPLKACYEAIPASLLVCGSLFMLIFVRWPNLGWLYYVYSTLYMLHCCYCIACCCCSAVRQ